MGSKLIKIFGFLLLFLGILGILILETNIIGYASLEKKPIDILKNKNNEMKDNSIKVEYIKSDENKVIVGYTFDNKNVIGESTYVEIWVKNPDGFEVSRIQDQFSIKKYDIIKREIEIELKKPLNGVYSIFFSSPYDKENYLKKTVILGNSKTSANVVFNVNEGKAIPYSVFLIFIAIGIFFIFKSHKESVQRAFKKQRKDKFIS